MRVTRHSHTIDPFSFHSIQKPGPDLLAFLFFSVRRRLESATVPVPVGPHDRFPGGKRNETLAIARDTEPNSNMLLDSRLYVCGGDGGGGGDSQRRYMALLVRTVMA